MNGPQPTERRGLGRALAGSALLLATLLAIVALASGGDSQWGTVSAGDRSTLPAGAFSYFYAVFLLAGAVAVPFFFYVYTRTTAHERARRARRQLLLTAAVAALPLLLVVVSPSLRGAFSDAFGRLAVFEAALGRQPASRAARPPAPDWSALAVVSSIAAAGGGGLLAGRALRRRRRLDPAPLAATLSSAFDDSLDDLRSEPDARRAIILAYARMEAALGRSGVGRHGAEAPLEYLARVLLALDVTPAPVRALTDLFERAKFSQHAIGPERKAEALGALEQIRDELRELA